MNRDKAIEILSLIDHADDWELTTEDINAIKLGIEGITLIQKLISTGVLSPDFKLLGETEE